MPLSVEVVGLEGLRKGLTSAPKTLETGVRSAMQESLLLLEADMRQHVPRDTGQLGGGISHRIEGSGASISGRVGPQARYAIYVEKGRKPGKYPPIAAVAGWARRHGIPPFLVARAIGRRGVRARPFVGPALDRHKAEIERLFAQVGARVTAAIKGD